MTQNRHVFDILIFLVDREDPISLGEAVFHGEDYDAFGGAEARLRLLSEGDLIFDTNMVGFDQTSVPIDKVERVEVRLREKARPPVT